MSHEPFDTDSTRPEEPTGPTEESGSGPAPDAPADDGTDESEAPDDAIEEPFGTAEPATEEDRAGNPEEDDLPAEPEGPFSGDVELKASFSDENGEAEGPDASSSLPDLSGARVLVIEDETPVANFVAEFFNELGAQVVQAHDGARGIELFESERPDLVLCDLLLPKRNGFQLLDEMAASAPSTPVVVMSGVYGSERYLEELPHAKLFLDKPLTLDSLAKAARLLAGIGVRPRRKADSTEEPVQPKPSGRRRAREPWIPTRLVPLARMLHMLWRDGRTGLLTHRNGERQTVFMLREGQVHFVRCNDPELSLGKVLTSLGKVQGEELDRARAELEERVTPTRLGEVLVELELLTATDLKAAVQMQLRKIIAGAFGQVAGETLFHEESESSDEDIVINTDTRAVIVAGCAAFRGEAEQLLGHLPDGDCRVELTCAPDDPALKLPPAERRLLEAIEAPMRLADVMAMAQLMGLRPRPLLFGLLCAEVLRVVEAGQEWETHAPTTVGAVRELDPATPPASWLLSLEDEEVTGTLVIEDGDQRAWLAFDQGRLSGAGSDDQRSRLGERLRRSGLVSDEQLEIALEVKAQCPRKPLGRIFVEMGSLEPAQLIHAVRAQVLGIATELLSRRSWPQAHFDEGRLPDAEPVDLGLSTADVVLEGLRRMEAAALERLAGCLAMDRPKVALKTLNSGRFSLNDTEEMVARALSHETENLLRSLTSADESDPDVLRMLVAGLLVTPVVETAEAV